MFVPLRVRLDMVEQYLINTGYTLVRNDYNSCDLVVTVLEQGELFDDLAGYSATIVVSRADEVIINDFMVVTDVLSIKLPNSMYAVEGEVRADIALYKEGAKKTLQPFTFKVRKDISLDGVVQGDTRIGVLEGLINQTTEVVASAQEEVDKAKAVNDVLIERKESDYYRGAKGDKGNTGEQGIQGIKGDKGDTGEQGIQGIKGDKGDTGEQGIQGIKGDKGDTGEQGIQGIKGDKGDTGEQGIQGIKGDKGDTGEQGIQGIKGDKGDKGLDGVDTIARASIETLTNISKFYTNPKASKKISVVGDSTSDQSVSAALYERLNAYTVSGCLLDGATIVNRGDSGNTIQRFIAGQSYNTNTITATIADQADLYVVSYGINDIRCGTNSPSRTQAQVKADLKTLIDRLLSETTGYILLRTPNPFLTVDTIAQSWVSPNSSAQLFSDQLYQIYESFRGYNKRIDVIDIPNLVFGKKCLPTHPLMINQLHPSPNGYRAIADAITEHITNAHKDTKLSYDDIILKGTIESATSSQIILAVNTFDEDIKVGDIVLLGNGNSFIVSNTPQFQFSPTAYDPARWILFESNIDCSKYGIVKIIRKLKPKGTLTSEQYTGSDWVYMNVPDRDYANITTVYDLQTWGLSGSLSFDIDFKYYTSCSNAKKIYVQLFFNNNASPATITGGVNSAGNNQKDIVLNDITKFAVTVSQSDVGTNRYMHVLVVTTRTTTGIPTTLELGELNVYGNGTKFNTIPTWYVYNDGTGATVTSVTRRNILATKKYIDENSSINNISNKTNNWNYGSINKASGTTVNNIMTIDLLSLGLSTGTSYSFRIKCKFYSKSALVTGLYFSPYFSSSPTVINQTGFVTGSITCATGYVAGTVYIFDGTLTIDPAGSTNRYLHLLPTINVGIGQKTLYEIGEMQLFVDGVEFNISTIPMATRGQEAGSFIKNNCYVGNSTIQYRDFIDELIRLGVLIS